MADDLERIRLENALRGYSPRLQSAFFRAIQRATGRVNERRLIELLQAGNVDAAVALLALTDADLFELREAVRAAFNKGGNLTQTAVPKAPAGAFYFNGAHERAEAWAAIHVAGLIEGIKAQSQEAVRSVILNGIRNGQGTQQLARLITGKKVGDTRVGGILGLNGRITDSIISGRAKLLSGDPRLMREYLGLELRDKRYDAMIERYIAAEKPIRGPDLDRIMLAHRMKALGQRGRVIGKNETRDALAAGRHEGFAQVYERNDVETITKRWQHNLSKEPRPSHVAMNGTVIGFNESFDFGDAMMRYPHDERGPARHRIGCNCMAMYRVRFKR